MDNTRFLPRKPIQTPLTKSQPSAARKSGSILDRAVELLSSLFTPLINIIVAAGVLKGFLALFSMLNILDSASSTYIILSSAADAFFFFLPVFLAFTAAKKFEVNPFTAVAVACTLVHPAMTALLSGQGITFFSLPVASGQYSSTIIPILLSVFALKYVEKFFTKILPAAIRNIFTPLGCLLVMIPVTLIVLGPLGNFIGSALADGYQTVYGWNSMIAGAVIGMFYQVLVVFGFHWAFVPIMIGNAATMGYDTIQPLLGPGLFSQAGAALGVCLKAKDKKLKSLAGSMVVTTVLGVTEPAIFSVNLPLKRPMVCACLAGGIGGAIAGSTFCRCVAFAPPSITSLPAYMGEGFTTYLIACLTAFVLAAAFTFFAGFEEPASSPSSDSMLTCAES